MKNILSSAFRAIISEDGDLKKAGEELVDIGADDLFPIGFWIVCVSDDECFLSPNLVDKFDIDMSDGEYRISKFTARSSLSSIKREADVLKKISRKCNLNREDSSTYDVYMNKNYIPIKKNITMLRVKGKSYMVGVNKILEKV